MPDDHMPSPLTAHPSGPLKGSVRVPGDKPISHLALIIGALATGRTRIKGLIETDDVLETAKAVTALGVPVRKVGEIWEVLGRGVGGFAQPSAPIEFGNPGTGLRLMMGVIAGQPITVSITGDASVANGPLASIVKPLKLMGLQVAGGDVDTLPLTVTGSSTLVPITYDLPVPSAQLKSAVLIAGLAAIGETTVITETTRDHTERMLQLLGAKLRIEKRGRKVAITITGESELEGRDITVPADPCSAAVFASAALIVPGSEVTVEGVLVNPKRRCFFDTLIAMGAKIAFTDERIEAGEPVADLLARTSRLKGARVPPDLAHLMINEYPILAVVAAFAEGETRIEGLGKLNIEESDRLRATVDGLGANGVAARFDGDTLIVTGSGASGVKGGGRVVTSGDHRIATSFLVMGLASAAPVTIDDHAVIAKTFDEFRGLMEGIGARFS